MSEAAEGMLGESPPQTPSVLPFLAVAHLVVDACCATAVFRIAWQHALSPETFVSLLFLYHAMAFGLQPLLGLAVDTARADRWAAGGGCLVSALALLFPTWPLATVVVAALGNAGFHVGAGAACLRLAPHRATAAGWFVAPGSLGLLLGTIWGKSPQAWIAPLFATAIVTALLLVRQRVPQAVPAISAEKPIRGLELVVGLVLFAITIRSLLGFLVTFPWETQPLALLLLTLATTAGKALGGILADRWGWRPVGVGAMLAALPFLAAVSTYPWAAIPGLLLLNLTMPVTLAALAEAIPGHPAFAFGLASLALLLGAVPVFWEWRLDGPGEISLVIVLASLALYRGLRWLASISCPSETVEEFS